MSSLTTIFEFLIIG